MAIYSRTKEIAFGFFRIRDLGFGCVGGFRGFGGKSKATKAAASERMEFAMFRKSAEVLPMLGRVVIWDIRRWQFVCR